MRCFQGFAEESFGCRSISFAAEHKVDGVAFGINCSVEVLPPLFDFDISLIDAVGVVGRLQIRLGSFLQFRSVMLDPAKDGRMIDCKASLVHHFFDISVAEGITQVPADAQENDFSFIAAALEGSGFGHEQTP